MLTIALPKGRLGDKVYDMLEKIGYGCVEMKADTRKLILEDSKNNVRYLLVKPVDVAIYVETGAADIGVVGKDILLEKEPDVLELLDLRFGNCRMSVAAKKGYKDDPERKLRVATKFVNIARGYYHSLNRDVEIIKLNGSIELAPILDMSDVIVDIVETGTTLKENNLEVLTAFCDISARLIANQSSFRFKNSEVEALVTKVKEVIPQ